MSLSGNHASKQVCGGNITQCSKVSRLCCQRFLSLMLSHFLKVCVKVSQMSKFSILSFLSIQDPKMYQFKRPKLQSLQRFQGVHFLLLSFQNDRSDFLHCLLRLFCDHWFHWNKSGERRTDCVWDFMFWIRCPAASKPIFYKKE